MSGPLLTKDLSPEVLDYDNYWDPDIRANIDGFELLSEAEYRELLKRTCLFVQESQRTIFDEMNRTKRLHKRREQTSIFTAHGGRWGQRTLPDVIKPRGS